MPKHERLAALLHHVGEAKSVSVEQVADEFDVSVATARRDLDELAAQQLVVRTRGGAVAHTVTYDLPLRYKVSNRSDPKRAIAAAAAALVGVGQVVGFNGGTTTTEVARSVARRVENGASDALNAITIVTNAVNIAHELAVRPAIKVVVVGGVLRPQSFELIGPFAEQLLAGVGIDVAFLGVDAISAGDGASARDEAEAHINAALAARARRIVVVADNAKLGGRSFCSILPASDIDVLVTDSTVSRACVEEFEAAGIEVLVAH